MAIKKKAPVKAKVAPKKASASVKAKVVAPKTVKAKKAAPAPKKAVKAKPAPSRPVGPREQKLASSALQLVDEAASLLRRGITSGADTTEKNRAAAKKKAHTLLSKATTSLASLLDSGSSAIHNVIGKI